jgi:hypothetical protein
MGSAKGKFLITCYVCEMYIRRKVKHIHKRKTHLLVRENVKTRAINARVQLKKNSGRGSQRA